MLVSQFIIQEKRSKEHLTPRRPDIGGPIKIRMMMYHSQFFLKDFLCMINALIPV